jgi:DNA-binding response OmpR family regulator
MSITVPPAPSAQGTSWNAARCADGPLTGVVIDPETRLVSIDGVVVELPFLEFELLAYLIAHPWQVHTRATLLREVWRRPPARRSRTVDIHVARVRAKLGPHRERLQTVRGVGYRYAPVDVSIAASA